MLKEGLSLYPERGRAVRGAGVRPPGARGVRLGPARFRACLVLDPGARGRARGAGRGPPPLRREGGRALALFRRSPPGLRRRHRADADDRAGALPRGAVAECRDIFAKAAAGRPDSAEAAASLGYALHRLGDDVGAGRQIRRALRLDPDLHEARVYLGHLLYDRGDWEGALREFERVPPHEHWDALGVWRLMELKRALWQMESGDARLSLGAAAPGAGGAGRSHRPAPRGGRGRMGTPFAESATTRASSSSSSAARGGRRRTSIRCG
jgi:hypothetical protein